MKHVAYFTIVNYPLDIHSIHKHNMYYNAFQLGGSFLNLITLTISDPFSSPTYDTSIDSIHSRHKCSQIHTLYKFSFAFWNCIAFVTLRDPMRDRDRTLWYRTHETEN